MIKLTSPTVFTLGYQRRSVKDYVRLLRAARIDVLVDVRETAWSHKPGFSKTRLTATLSAHGIRYLHVRFAGNPKHLRRRAASHEHCLVLYRRYLDANPTILETFDEVLGRLLDAGKRVCLTCYERHPDDCHRGILAARWKSGFWRRVEHLGADASCRLIKPTMSRAG